MDKKKKILYILLAALGIAVLYRLTTVPEEKMAPLKYKTGAKAVEKGMKGQGKGLPLQTVSRGAGSQEIGLPQVELSKLLSIKRRPPTDGINLFSPFFIKEPPKLPELPKQPLPPPVDPLEEELKLFRFMGFLEKKEPFGRDKKIFLAKGQNIYIVKSGEIIEGRFKVNVMQGMIEISVIDSEKMVTIPAEEK